VTLQTIGQHVLTFEFTKMKHSAEDARLYVRFNSAELVPRCMVSGRDAETVSKSGRIRNKRTVNCITCMLTVA